MARREELEALTLAIAIGCWQSWVLNLGGKFEFVTNKMERECASPSSPLCNAHPRANVEPRDARGMGSGEVCAGQGAGQIIRQEDPGQRELAQATKV
ncbi:hypothetical protein ON010_g3720 [Phytophthora cinnamomi]|nr:hypothetical protein ON010_g3720 [Phytophthora cinnamomi]